MRIGALSTATFSDCINRPHSLHRHRSAHTNPNGLYSLPEHTYQECAEYVLNEACQIYHPCDITSSCRQISRIHACRPEYLLLLTKGIPNKTRVRHAEGNKKRQETRRLVFLLEETPGKSEVAALSPRALPLHLTRRNSI